MREAVLDNEVIKERVNEILLNFIEEDNNDYVKAREKNIELSDSIIKIVGYETFSLFEKTLSLMSDILYEKIYEQGYFDGLISLFNPEKWPLIRQNRRYFKGTKKLRTSKNNIKKVCRLIWKKQTERIVSLSSRDLEIMREISRLYKMLFDNWACDEFKY